MIFFAKKARGIDMSHIVALFTLPGSPEYVDGLSYYIPSEDGILELLNKEFATGDKVYTASDLNLIDLAHYTAANVGGIKNATSTSSSGQSPSQSSQNTYQGGHTPAPSQEAPTAPEAPVNEETREPMPPSDYQGY